MQKRKPKKNKSHKMWLVGILTAMMISLITIAILALMLLNSVIAENKIPFIVAAIQLVSVFAGALISAKKIGEKHMLSTAVVAVGYYLLLLVQTLLVFDGTFHKLITGTFMCMIGAVLAWFVSLQHVSGRKRKKRRL